MKDIMSGVNNIFGWFYYIFALIWTFKFWGIGWGIISIVFPIFPLIDLARYAVDCLAVIVR